MTTSPSPDKPDTEGKTVPPYDGRRESADMAGAEKSTKDGAKTAGATGPVEDGESKAPDPKDTEGGEHASPADEQPAEESSKTTEKGDDLSAVGPAHEPGTGRAEDKS